MIFGFGFCSVRVLAYFFLLSRSGSVRFLAETGFSFGSFLSSLSSFPSLYTTCRVTVTVGDTETQRFEYGFQPRLDALYGRIRRSGKIILARYVPLNGSANVATFIGVDLS